nr:EOG090X0IJO [Polyphemus pediculus]
MDDTSAPDLAASELPVVVSNLNDVKTIIANVSRMVQNITKKVRSKELFIHDGMSFLDVKNNMLLDYLINLGCIMLKKSSGESIEGSSAVDHLVEIRTVLERMRPLEHKLKYQIEKLLKLATEGKLSENDPLQFKANPQNMLSKVQESSDEDQTEKKTKKSGVQESSDEDQTEKKTKKSGVYAPPKIASMHYDGDKPNESFKAAEKNRKTILSSSVLQNLREEYLDTPLEMVEVSGHGSKLQIAKERQTIQEYEETYFTRLPSTKEDRHRSRLQHSSKSLDAELIGETCTGSVGKRKNKNFGGKKRGGFKKRKF